MLLGRKKGVRVFSSIEPYNEDPSATLRHAEILRVQHVLLDTEPRLLEKILQLRKKGVVILAAKPKNVLKYKEIKVKFLSQYSKMSGEVPRQQGTGVIILLVDVTD